MGTTFNFSDLQQKADRVIHNADEAVRKWVDLVLAPAKDVPIEYYDKSGNLVQTTVPNRAKLFNDLLVNVNSAMVRNVNVDAVNGNDGNTGETSTSAVKSVPRAIELVPSGGYGRIYLREGQVHEITSTIYVDNKLIEFVPMNPVNGKPILRNISYINQSSNQNETTGFALRHSRISFWNVDIETANLSDPALPLSIWEGFIKRFDLGDYRILFFASNIKLGDTDLIRTPSGSHSMVDVHFYACNVSQVGQNRGGFLIYNEQGHMGVSFTAGSITLLGGVAGSLNDVIAGIVRDANGVPRNLISNRVL